MAYGSNQNEVHSKAAGSVPLTLPYRLEHLGIPFARWQQTIVAMVWPLAQGCGAGVVKWRGGIQKTGLLCERISKEGLR